MYYRTFCLVCIYIQLYQRWVHTHRVTYVFFMEGTGWCSQDTLHLITIFTLAHWRVATFVHTVWWVGCRLEGGRVRGRHAHWSIPRGTFFLEQQVHQVVEEACLQFLHDNTDHTYRWRRWLVSVAEFLLWLSFCCGWVIAVAELLLLF